MCKKKEKNLQNEDPQVVAQKQKRKKIIKAVVWPIVSALLLVFVLNIIILPLTGKYERVDRVDRYDGDNQYIVFDTAKAVMLSAHRAGGDLAPEETMLAFKHCMEATDYVVDVVEFDLHLTKDGHLVLMHDHEVDRTSNGPQVFGKKGVKIKDKTLAELETLNFGYNFCDLQGNYPYRDLPDDQVPDDVRILTLEKVLTYLESVRPNKDLNYIIEIKDGGKEGKLAMDKLYEAMERHDILDRTIVGTFQGDITSYIDKTYGGRVTRSAGILEVLNFYYAFLWGRSIDVNHLGYRVLQIPMGLTSEFFDFSSRAFIDYAHSLGIAVQYWTINDPNDVGKLAGNGADCIMTDNPAMAYEILNNLRTNGAIGGVHID